MSNPQNTSILDKNWQAKTYDERMVLAIMQKYSISEILAKLLNIRKIPLNEIAYFLDPKIKNILPNPFELGDMKIAVDHVMNAINSRRQMARSLQVTSSSDDRLGTCMLRPTLVGLHETY